MSIHYWLVVHPDLTQPIGGVKQLHRLAESIVSLGRKATIIQDNSQFHPGWFTSDVQTISYLDWIYLRDNKLHPTRDVVVFPETYLVSALNYSRGLPSIIFNQNGSYTFGLPDAQSFVSPDKILALYNQDFIKHVFCVSQYDYNFLSRHVLSSASKVSCIVNGLEESVRCMGMVKKRQIVYMPRKNSLDASIVTSLISNCPSLAEWILVPIVKLSHAEVVSILRESYLFLSFGHPEGFGLPVAEAMACGCGVIGYSGLGGRELFKVGSACSTAEEISLGDWGSYVSAIEHFELSLRLMPEQLHSALSACSQQILNTYNLSSMRSSIESALISVESSL